MPNAACTEVCPGSPRAGGGQIDRRRAAVLLMTYGSVDSLRQVEAYYTRIRRGSPPPPELLAELIERYRAIGGASPLAAHTERQRAALEAELDRRGRPVAVYAGMRYAPPFITEVVTRMASDGITHVVGLPLAPHFSRASTCAYCTALDEARREFGGLSYEMVRAWHAEPRLVLAWTEALTAALGRFGDGPESVAIVFTAHSLPLRAGGRGDPYPALVRETAQLLAAAIGAPAERWSVAFQSAGRSDEPWLGPGLRERLVELAAAGAQRVVVAPIGFVADHLEVLYDLDIEAAGWAGELGLTLVRARSPNDAPTFIGALADVVERRLAPAAV
jgi:protoporphyrin/coproporphyrin ferrochelatase